MRHRRFNGVLVAAALASCMALASSATATTPSADSETVSESFVASTA